MILVIQCASKKPPDAGCLQLEDGTPVLFVANPAIAPHDTECVYARPDDLSDNGISWRERLTAYNRDPGDNPLGLCQAFRLYLNPVYERLVREYGLRQIYILSAGWGLIAADFLTPKYDITFSPSVNKEGHRHKLRKKQDRYQDFCMLPDKVRDPIVFFGGKDYVPLFFQLTGALGVTKTIFFNSKKQPDAPGCDLIKFETRTKTNWHYECANAFLDGKIGVGGP